jgi:predicted heme/steroid binding protein
MRKRRFTRRELARYNGKDGAPAFIAFEGRVYDVSRSFLWQNGSHQALHAAGRDLTGSLEDAPHPPDLLNRVLKNSLLPRLLKKVQMQGGAPGTHPEDGCPQVGLFQQPVKRFPMVGPLREDWPPCGL